MPAYSLRQPYLECVELDCLLRDAPRRLLQAGEQGLLPQSKDMAIHVVGSGFSAVLAYHALRDAASLAAIHDPAEALPNDLFGATGLSTMNALDQIREGQTVLLAAAPTKAHELMSEIDTVVGPNVRKILLFAPDGQDQVQAADDSGWIRLNMNYRCVHMAVNLSRRYRAIPCDNEAPTAIMGTNLAGLLARMALVMARSEFAGFVEPGQDAPVPGSMLLVTLAPHTFADKEESLCAGSGYASAQFLFRETDATIQAFAWDGFSNLRLLGAGEEGMVFEALDPSGEPCCYKAFFRAQDRSELMAWSASIAPAAPGLAWMAEARGVPDAHAGQGVVQPMVKLAHIPFMDESKDEVLRALVTHSLQVQKGLVGCGYLPGTMLGGIHAMCDRDGALRFVDMGNLPPRIDQVPAQVLKASVIKGLAGLAHETLFSGITWSVKDPVHYAQAVAERIGQGDAGLPQWYPAMLRDVLAMAPQAFTDPAAYGALAERHGLGRATLPRDVAERAHSPALGVAPAPRVLENGQSWYRECLYQTFLYRPGQVQGFGRTGDKYALIREPFEREVRGRKYLDIGSNQGFFLAQASLKGAERCTGIEQVPELQVQSRRMFQEVGLDNVEILGLKVGSGSPLPEYDVVSAFAVIHHLYLVGGSYARFADLVDYLAQAARKCLFIEYVHNPGYLERAQRRHARDFSDYTEQIMAQELERRYSHVEKLADVSDTRSVYCATRA